jgi:hypothetical protein
VTVGQRAFCVLAAVSAIAPAAWALDPTFAGYGLLDNRQFIGSSTGQLPPPRAFGIDGTTLEIAQKLVLDVTPDVNVTVKVCFGCHGVELAQGYAEWQINDHVNLRAGRFNVPVGEFNSRSDPSNYTAPSKPLPYAMGDMLFYQYTAFNLGVVPTPFIDNGVELFGSVSLGRKAQLDYTFYAVKGLEGSNDIDFIQTRQYLDNNHTPGLGTRVVLSAGPTSFGASAGGGYYDPQDRLRYAFLGAEAYARWGPLVFRGEVIERLTDFDPTAAGYLYVPKEPYFIKVGWYGQVDWNASEWMTLVLRSDGLHRMGIPIPGAQITDQSSGIFRQTAGVLLRSRQGFALKAGYEYWALYGTPFSNQHVVRLGVLYSY